MKQYEREVKVESNQKGIHVIEKVQGRETERLKVLIKCSSFI